MTSNSRDRTNRLLIRNVMSHFLPMVDGLYERKNLLIENGFEVPQIEAGVVRYFCDDNTIVELEHEYNILASKNAVSQGDYQADYINDKFRKGKKKREATGEPWHAAPSPFWQRFIKSESIHYRQHHDVMRRFFKEKKTAWLEEVRQYSTVLFKTYDENKVSSWIKLIEDLSSECALKEGFVRNKKISNNQKIVFLKHIDKKWSIYLSFDLAHFKKQLHPNNIIKSTEVLFGLVCLENNRSKINSINTLKSVLSFRYFFPIDIVFTDYLKSFETLQELEALIKMYFVLYGLISEEFERIALNTVLKLRSNCCG